ncbi:MAG: type II toxin-antitoxin system Phd/YefM family antitoxin [Thermaerobacter sp.]|nr:type II toxin-antitoxin system Phd/YefM family antitoxin [Thermaerobacter sp.]
MKSVNVHEAKTNLSRLLEEVSQGAEVTIARAGKPVARLVPFEKPEGVKRVPGFLRGKIRIADDFDGPLPPDLQAGFEGADS